MTKTIISTVNVLDTMYHVFFPIQEFVCCKIKESMANISFISEGSYLSLVHGANFNGQQLSISSIPRAKYEDLLTTGDLSNYQTQHLKYIINAKAILCNVMFRCSQITMELSFDFRIELSEDSYQIICYNTTLGPYNYNQKLNDDVKVSIWEVMKHKNNFSL